MTARFRVECQGGRLVEARIWRLASVEDVDAYSEQVIEQAQASRSGPVLCADHRRANVYAPAVADRLALAFKPNNHRFERIAILVSTENAMLIMQLQRLTREAGSDRRKVFLQPDDALEHLALTLEAEDLTRARAFLERPGS